MAMTTRSKEGRGQGGLGGRLRLFRRGRNLTQAELAGRADISEDTVSKLELGRHRRPHPSTIRKLAAALGVSEEDITGGVVARR